MVLKLQTYNILLYSYNLILSYQVSLDVKQYLKKKNSEFFIIRVENVLIHLVSIPDFP